jgi:hypothetical protein
LGRSAQVGCQWHNTALHPKENDGLWGCLERTTGATDKFECQSIYKVSLNIFVIPLFVAMGRPSLLLPAPVARERIDL